MTLTRANAETILVKRLGPLMAAAGMAVTYAGANDDLSDPIGWAVRQAGGTVTSLVSVTDADVATVADADLDKMLVLAEYRVLSSIQGYSALGSRTRVQRRLDRVATQLHEMYGWPHKQATFGTINLSIHEHGD